MTRSPPRPSRHRPRTKEGGGNATGPASMVSQWTMKPPAPRPIHAYAPTRRGPTWCVLRRRALVTSSAKRSASGREVEQGGKGIKQSTRLPKAVSTCSQKLTYGGDCRIQQARKQATQTRVEPVWTFSHRMKEEIVFSSTASTLGDSSSTLNRYE